MPPGGKVLNTLRKMMTIEAEEQLTRVEKVVVCNNYRIMLVDAVPGGSAFNPRGTAKLEDWARIHSGHTLWEASHLLNSYLVGNNVCRDKRVLELGCGLGVCGMMAHRAGAAAVVLTDGDESLLPIIRKSITTNRMEESEDEKKEDEEGLGGGRRIQAEMLRWGVAPDIEHVLDECGKFDIIIASDVLYVSGRTKREGLACLDGTVHAFFMTAALLLGGAGGSKVVLAHDLRDPADDVLEAAAKHATGQGFGPPRLVKTDGSRQADRVVLEIPFLGGSGLGNENKSESREIILEQWVELFPFLGERCVSGFALPSPPRVVTTKQLTPRTDFSFYDGDDDAVDGQYDDDDDDDDDDEDASYFSDHTAGSSSHMGSTTSGSNNNNSNNNSGSSTSSSLSRRIAAGGGGGGGGKSAPSTTVFSKTPPRPPQHSSDGRRAVIPAGGVGGRAKSNEGTLRLS